jgi:hypothetical protein
MIKSKITLDACCYHYIVPSELVKIINDFYTEELTNETIKNAIAEWLNFGTRDKCIAKLIVEVTRK